MEEMQGQGRVAFVTGGGRGIGKALAVGLAEVGYDVVVASTTAANNEAVAEEIREGGGRALPVVLDVGVEDSVTRAVELALGEFGRIDVLINNAGLKGGYFPSDRRRLADVPLDHWRRMFAVNVEGPLMCAQRCVPAMRAAGAGSIINIGSGATDRDQIGGGPYAASKSALAAFARTLAAELRDNHIAVNTINPGSTLTEQNAGRDGGERKLKTATSLPLVRFLAGQRDAQVTGQTIDALKWNVENGFGGREVWGV